MKQLVVLGGGESGVGTALLAKQKGFQVLVSDRGNLKEKYRSVLSQNEIEFEEGDHSLDRILSADIVVKSPGIPRTVPIVQDALKKGIPVIGEIEFAAGYFKGQIVAITGSNGKTTTTALTHHVFEQAGTDPIMGGNIGQSFAEQVINRTEGIAILEVSSFQLDDTVHFKPHVAVLLNITPDHLDRYNNNMDEYIASKFQITQNQDENDYLVYNLDDENITNYLTKNSTRAKLIPFSIEKQLEEGAWLEENNLNININNTEVQMTIQKLALQGKHNIYNSMAAGVAGKVLELRKEVIRESLSDFENLEHRLEHVVKVCGVNYINDSKATNINSTWYALESLDRPVVWIVGGVDKGNDYDMLKELVQDKVKAIVCLGLDNSKIQEAFEGVIDTVVDTQSMRDAVAMAYKLSDKGDTVLLSPACASFDLFENYEERGRQFKEAVRGL